MQRIEKGEPECAIGAVFEVATIVGVNLFDANQTTLTKLIRQTEEKLALSFAASAAKLRLKHTPRSGLFICAALR